MVNLLEIGDEELASLLSSGRLTLSIYGLGYVGLSLVAVWLRAGARVIGVDVNPQKVAEISRGIVDSYEKAVVEAINRGLKEEKFKATLDGVQAARESHVKIVTVPVSLDENKKPVFKALREALRTIGGGLKRGDLVIIESSVPVGTTSNLAKPLLEEVSKLKVEKDFGLAYSPERIYIGRAVKDIEENYPKIIAGIGEKSLKAATKLYRLVARKGVIQLPTPEYAELEKLLEGVYRDVNIALANQLALLCRALGLDYDKVREAANSQPFCHLHKPGAGVGGACIPVYSIFVQNMARNLGVKLNLVEEGRRINDEMSRIVTDIVKESVEKAGLKKPVIAILGLAFRGGIDDTRYSPAYKVIENLLEYGYAIRAVHDPYVKKDNRVAGLEIELTNSLEKALRGANVVVIVTDHPEYKKIGIKQFKELSGKSEVLVVDARHVIEDWENPPRGVLYTGVGRPFIFKV
ncbi:MAG: nucleotide sugar dehydrogenase [Thermoprotei archaeon]|nr:MAG: nucleotide sugar dehydrogenase [Thermoprotei archaeon]